MAQRQQGQQVSYPKDPSTHMAPTEPDVPDGPLEAGRAQEGRRNDTGYRFGGCNSFWRSLAEALLGYTTSVTDLPQSRGFGPDFEVGPYAV